MTDSNIPLIDYEDHEILMHRDAHFHGRFSDMIAHYQRGGPGTILTIDLERIAELQELELKIKQNLSAFLTEEEQAKVIESKKVYASLGESLKSKNKISSAIARLILSEEAKPQQEIEALIQEKSFAVLPLINILKTDHFSDPLFPGFGKAPELAIHILGAIGDKRAIIAIFESLNNGDFFDEENGVEALKRIGLPARDFLLKVVEGKPHTADNENAALALIAFKDDPKVSDTALKLLEEIDFQKESFLAEYLVLLCEEISDIKHRDIFKKLANKSSVPHEVKKDMEIIIKSWD